MTKHFKQQTKKDRSIKPTPEQLAEAARIARVLEERRIAAEETRKEHERAIRISNHSRRDNESVLTFAERILKAHGRLDHHGYLDGKKSLPAERIVAANQIRKNLGFDQIAASREWLV